MDSTARASSRLECGYMTEKWNTLQGLPVQSLWERVFVWYTGRQMILNWMIASSPWMSSVLNFTVNASVCYWFCIYCFNEYLCQISWCSVCVQDEDCNFYFIWHTMAACPPYRFADCRVTHNGQLYDLSQLSDSMSNYVVVQRQLNIKFLMNICQSVVFGNSAPCEYTSAVCLVNLTTADPTRR
jgi:hypothetical protein